MPPRALCKQRQSTRLFEDRPDEGFEEDQQGLDEHGWMDDVEGLDVLLVPAKKREKLLSLGLVSGFFFQR